MSVKITLEGRSQDVGSLAAWLRDELDVRAESSQSRPHTDTVRLSLLVEIPTYPAPAQPEDTDAHHQ